MQPKAVLLLNILCVRKGCHLCNGLRKRIGMQAPWRERSLGKALEKLSKGDYVLVSRLIYLGNSIDECCEIMAFLADRQIFFYDLNSKWSH